MFLFLDKIGYIRNQLNTFDKNIQLNYEMEKYNQLAFLDVVVIINTDYIINITVYRKPTNTDICINWHSHFLLQWKKPTTNVTIQRAMRIHS